MFPRFLGWLGLVVLVLLLSSEAGLRLIGMGNPALSVAHPTIEYMFAPNQDVSRFGNRVLINAWGMRSPDLEKKKPAGQYRVMVLGDSVVNGGNLTDHAALATTLLSSPTRFLLNASAGSWGAANMLAYVREYGFFDADLVVVVLSGGDVDDVVTFEALNPDTHPTIRPVSAIAEFASRYVARYAKRGLAQSLPAASAAQEPEKRALPDVRALLKAAGARGPVCLIMHASRPEMLTGRNDHGYEEIRDVALSEGVRVVEDRNIMSPASYRDDIHLTAEGQKGLAKAIQQCLAASGDGG